MDPILTAIEETERNNHRGGSRSPIRPVSVSCHTGSRDSDIERSSGADSFPSSDELSKGIDSGQSSC